MVRLNRLLAATDLSAPARHAAERAALLARHLGASLDLVHVASLAPLEKLRRLVADVPAQLDERVLEVAREEMLELAATLRQRHGISAEVRVVSGQLLPQLSQLADAIAADLIVFGARGASFMQHRLLGSSAERLVRRASRPALVVKQTAHEPYRNVLVPVDFSPHSLPALQRARAIAPDAVIALLHACEVPFEGKLRFAGVAEATINHYRESAWAQALQSLQALCDTAGLPPRSVRVLLLHGDPVQQILQQEQERDCDLIVMGKHGESALEDLLLGSVTRHVLARSQCDVVVSV